MSVSRANKFKYFLFMVLLGVLLGFQNCGSKTSFVADASKNKNNSSDNGIDIGSDADGDGIDDSVDDDIDGSGGQNPNENLSCFFNGEEVAVGDTVLAFQNSTVAAGSSCVSQERTCEDGNLSGSFNYPDCDVDVPVSCMFNGRMISSGESVDAFLNSKPAVGDSCQRQVRNCENGELSGSFNFETCVSTPFANCVFNGRTVLHNESIKGFQNSTVAAGSTCREEMRTCKNGVLQGTYNFASCSVNAPASCMFNGATIAHGEAVSAYQNSTVPAGQSCVSESRVCNDGVLTGSFNIGSCQAAAFATCIFDGKTIAHGQNVKAYASSSVPFGQACTSVVRKCTDGMLSNAGDFASCSVEAPKACNVNNINYAHGQTATFFASSTVPFGSVCSSEQRTCTNGVMSGTAPFGSCSVNAPASCLINGQTIAHGQSLTAYSATSVPHGQTCSAASQTRTCNNGALSGTASHMYTACTVDGYVSTGVTVSISCSISAANSQSLVLTLSNGTTKRWDFGSGERSIGTFTEKFASAPTKFQAYSNGSALSAQRFTNQTANTVNFNSEDGHDGDYNDLVCAFRW